MKGVCGTKPSSSPQKLSESNPLNVLLYQRLKYALDRQEARKIVKDKEKLIIIEEKVEETQDSLLTLWTLSQSKKQMSILDLFMV